VKRALVDYLAVPAIMNEDDVIARASAWLQRRSIDRVWSNWRALDWPNKDCQYDIFINNYSTL
jgi:hypothetical protein